MHRQALLSVLQDYRKHLVPGFAEFASHIDIPREMQVLAEFEGFIKGHPGCFQADHYTPGHCTGSALVVNSDLTKVVLTLHAKLHKWLQLGGHADGQGEMHEVALREVSEESGLEKLHLLTLSPHTSASILPLPFDWDIHLIPARADAPEHRHFDIRYLVLAQDEALIQSCESKDLGWFSLEEARRLTQEVSMHRQFDKLLLWKDKIRLLNAARLTGRS